MNPNDQPGPLPPVQPVQPGHPAQYDFITNPGKPPKRGLMASGKSGILMLVVGGLVLLIVILIVGSLFLGGSSDKETLLDVAQKQSEIIAVSELGADDGGTNQVQSLAMAVQLSMLTQQQGVVAQLNKNDKVKEKEYAASVSSEVTEKLESAERNGRFDEVFNTVMKDELTEYQQVLQTANNSAKNKSTKTLLASDFKNTGVLLLIPN